MNQAKPAGFWIRVLATLIDGIFTTVLTNIIGTLTNETPNDETPTQAIDSTASFMDIMKEQFSPSELASSLIYVIIFVIIFTASQLKGSPGKLICRIQVVNPDMTQISILKSIGRYLAYYVSIITLLIGFMMAGWNKEKKALHDMICNTRVVYRNQQ